MSIMTENRCHRLFLWECCLPPAFVGRRYFLLNMTSLGCRTGGSAVSTLICNCSVENSFYLKVKTTSAYSWIRLPTAGDECFWSVGRRKGQGGKEEVSGLWAKPTIFWECLTAAEWERSGSGLIRMDLFLTMTTRWLHRRGLQSVSLKRHRSIWKTALKLSRASG